LWIGIFDGDDNLGDAGFDQRIATGRRAAVVRAGFEGDVGGGAIRTSLGHTQCHRLGVGVARALSPAFADYMAVNGDDDTSNARVGF
jgi:hypothetical protein